MTAITGRSGAWARRASLRVAPVLVLLALLGVAAPAGAQGSESPGGMTGPAAGGLDGITAGTHYVMIVPETGGFRVAETVELRNASGAARDVVVLPLFSGAWDVQLVAGFDGAHVQLVPGAVQLERPLAPGERTAFTVAYRLMAQDLPFSLTRPVVYPTDRLVVLAPVDAPFALLAEGLTLGGVDTFSGRQVRVYDAGAVAPVGEWVLGLAPTGTPPWQDAGVPVVDHNRSRQGAWRPVVLGFGLMALWALGLRVAAAVRLRGLGLPRIEAWMEAADTVAPPERRRLAQRVVAAAANLEKAHRNRRLPDSIYRREREALLAAWKHLHPDGGEAGR
ncbi:MAG TPA: hypothetical protein VF282_10630 [Bacillota bacterium]